MANNEGWFSKISAEGIKEFLWEIMRSWLWPLLVPAMTALFGLAQDLPLMYISVGTVAAFAFVTHGLVKVTEWRFIRTPEFKIDFIEPNGGFDFDKTDPKKINGVYFGFTLGNHAVFPVEVEVMRLNTKFDNRVPVITGPIIRKLTIGMSGRCFFYDGMIDLRGMDLADKEVPACINFAVKYGVPGKAKFTYSRDIDLKLSFDKYGYYKTHSWSNSANPFE